MGIIVVRDEGQDIVDWIGAIDILWRRYQQAAENGKSRSKNAVDTID